MTPTFVQTKVSGGARLERMLQELPRRVRSKVTRKAINAGARIVSRDAKRLARRGKTKLLSKSIGIKGRTSRQGYFAKIGSRRGFAITLANGRPYDPTRIVHLVEKGTQPHEIQRGMVGRRQRKAIKHPGSRAYPFIGPSLTNNLGQVQGTVQSKMWEGIQQEVKSI